jgi:hypothetical protein
VLASVARADTAADMSPDVKTLLDAWLKAQNDGDFNAYEKLYAQRFTGIRRSGPRTVEMDRAGWMKDRGRMFRKKMTVTAADVKVKAARQMAQVVFTQTWESGTYKDTGPKQLVIIREGAAPRISQEELLRSDLDKSRAPVRLKDSEVEPFVWVVEGGVVLREDPDETWTRGATELELGSPTVTRRKVDKKALPPEIAGWQGKKVRAFDDKGRQVCESAVNGFRVVGRVYEHFGVHQEWNEKSKKEAADEAWGMTAKLLVGDLDPGCAKAMWARPAGLEPVEPVAFADADATVADQATKAFRKLAAYKTIQKEWLASEDGSKKKGNWGEPKVLTVKTTLGGKPIVLVSAHASEWESCSGFSGQLWALWELKNGKLILRNEPGTSAIVPESAADVDGDGNAEILFKGELNEFGGDRGLMRATDGKWGSPESLKIPFLDCPC